MSSVAHIIRRRRNKKQRRRSNKGRQQLWMGGALAFLTLVLVLPVAIFLGLVFYLYQQSVMWMPSPAESIYLDPIVDVTQLYANDERTLIYNISDPLGNERVWVELETLPSAVLDATLLMEDPDFLESPQPGVATTFDRLTRYMLGSTLRRDNSLTGNLVRNALLPAGRASGLDDVLLELVFIAEVNQRYAPRAILEWHLNTNYYGNNAYGIDAAALVYFGKSARDLTLDEIAMLAAIPPATRFNPFDEITAARGRQLDLLRQMLAQGRITNAEFDTATSTLTAVQPNNAEQSLLAPDFSRFARQQAENILDRLGMDGARMVARDGLRIVTTLDLDLYAQADCLMQAHFLQLAGGNPQNVSNFQGAPCSAVAYLAESTTNDPTALPDTGAVVLLDARTGILKAMVGDANAVTYQPGPTLLPFVYLEGFLSGDYTPATMVLDIPQPFAGPAEGLIYTPQNIDRQFRGPINLRDAMSAGLLPPAVQIADARRVSQVLNTAHLIGINSLRDGQYDLSILERGGAVSVLDVAYAYSVFANQGYMQGVDRDPIARNFRGRDPVAIQRIEDNEGNILWEYNADAIALSRTNIFSSDLGFLINDILADNVKRAEVLGRSLGVLNLSRPVAVVNGMTSDRLDNWTVGYTPQLVVGVHLGRADGQPLSLRDWGLQGAAPIWQALMQYTQARDSIPPANWERPENVAQYVVCEKSGMNPDGDGNCPTRTEYFLEEVPPFQTDTFWQTYELNSQTRQLATANTPANLRIESVYFVPPSEALDWWQSNNLPLPPTDYDILSRPEVLKAVQILVPSDFEYVGGTVDLRGAIETDEPFVSYQLAYGQGLNPTEWFEIGEAQTTWQAGTSLGLWDTTGLDGIYTLQLAVTLPDNSRDTDFVQVTVDNIAPVISMQAGEPGQVFRFPSDSTIPIAVTVTDNLAIDRVEFYHNGSLLGVDREWPYGFEFDITRSGAESFRAVVFDQVGNTSETTMNIDILRE
jgi:membrane peptidoglycan carboxypeptidase